MSLNQPPIEVIKVIDKSIDYTARRQYVAIQAPEVATCQTFTANNPSLASANVSINPPSSRTGMDSTLLLKVKGTIQVRRVGGGNIENFDIGKTDSLRAWPLHSCIQSETLSLNNFSTSINPNLYLHGLMATKLYDKEINTDCSLAPTMPDQFRDYDDYVNEGSARNVMSRYGENSYLMSRGGFIYEPHDNPPEPFTERDINVTLVEPVLVSPLYFSGKNQSLIGVTTASLFMTFDGLQNGRFWSRSRQANDLTPLSFTFDSTPANFSVEVLATFYSPSNDTPVPPLMQYPYSSLTFYNSGAKTANANGIEFNLNNVQLSSIPSQILLFVRRSNEYVNTGSNRFLSSDTFIPIRHVNVQFNNRDGLFSSCTPEQLYQISQRNGVQMSYPQWNKYRGSVVVITPSDIGMRPGEAAGVQGAYNFRCTVNTQGNTEGEVARNETYVLCAVVVAEGTFSITRGLAGTQTGVLSNHDVLTAQVDRRLNFDKAKSISRNQGGSFLSGLLSGVSKIGDIASSVGSVIDTGRKIMGKGLNIQGSGSMDREEFMRHSGY